MHQQAATVGDVLPRDVLDVSLDGVHVRHACVSLWRQRQGKFARLRECPFIAADFSRDGGVATLAPADEFPPVGRKLVDDGGWRRTDRRSRERPLHRARTHRRAEEIPRGNDSPQWLAGHRAIALERDIDAEVGSTVGGNQKRTVNGLAVRHLVVELWTRHVPRLNILRRLRFRLVDLEHRAHRVVAERAVGRQRCRPFGTAPVVDGDGTLVDDPVLAVAQGDEDRCSTIQETDAARRVLTKNGLEVHLFAQPIDSAIAEDGAAQHWLGLAAIEIHTEVPGLDPLVPVAADVGDVAIFLGQDDEVGLLPLGVALVAGVTPFEIRDPRTGRDAVGAGRAAPVDAVVAVHDRYLCAGNRRGSVEAGDKHQGVLGAVLDCHAKVRHLNKRRAGRLDGAPGIRDRRAVLDCGPDEARPTGTEGLRHVEAVRLDAVVGDAELASHRIDRRPDAKRRRQRTNCRHEVVGFQGCCPLLHVEEISRVERQHRSAARFPDAVTVAEAGECRAMPVLDRARPGVAERLSINGGQAGIYRDEVGCRRRLGGVPRVLERQRESTVPSPSGRIGRLLGRRNLGSVSCREVGHAKGLGKA